jgi:hypothetical protein
MPPAAKPAKPAKPARKPQLLHLVFGGELTGVDTVEFKDLKKLDVIGMFPDYASAHKAWQAAARQTIDNAHMRYFIVHLHRLLDPKAEKKAKKTKA